MRTRSRRTEEETQAPVDGSTTVDLCEPTALEAASAESWGGNGSYHVLLSSSSDTDEGDAGRPEVEPEVDREEVQQGQGAGALEAVGQRLGLAVETQNVDALLSSLRSLLALLAASQEQADSAVVLRDEELAAIVLPLMRASYIYAETLQEAQATAVRRMWLQAVLHLGALVSTGKGAQWTKLKEALLEEQISDVLVNRLKLRLEGWTEEEDDDGEGNSAVSSLLAVLSSLARHAEDHRLSEALGQAGACEVALQALATGLESRHATLLGASCCAMMSLCFRHPPNVGRLLELQAHAKVVETLNVTMGQGEATNGTAPVQAKGGQGKQAQVLASWACSCLASLMDYAPSPTAKQELQAQLGALGLPESLATLLRFKRLQAEPDALVLVMAAVVALLKGSKQNRARLREAGALQTLQAMSLLGGHASDRARSLRTRGDNVPRGSNTKGQEAYPELRLRVERAVEMLQHVEMEVEEPGSALNWVKQEDEASTELSKRPRTERSQAECELDLQGTREGRLDEPQAGDKGIRAASSNDRTYFSGDDMEHDGQMYPVPQQPRSSEPPPAHQSQEGELNGTMMDLEQVEEASVDDMEVFPLDDPDGGAVAMEEDDDEEAEAGDEPHLVEPTPTLREEGRSSMGREQEAAMGEKGQQHAETTPPEVERLQGISTDPQPPPSVSEDVSALVLMLGEANTSGDAAKASEALRRLIKADPPLEAPGERDELLPVLVQALAIFADRVSVIKHALVYLLDLTTDKLCCKQLMDLGVDRALASVIMASLHSLDLTKNACAVVLHMATWGYRDVSTELLVAVRAALKKYLKVAAVLQAFRSLLVPGSQALEVLAEDGWELVVARVLRWTSSRFGQLQAALECISSMCIGDSDVATTNRRHLGSQGVIDAIDSAITRYPKRAEILSAAVLALWTLSIDSDRNVQLMRTAGITTRLKGPGFQQIVQHHDCHLESCAVCLRLDLLRKLEATTSSEDDQCDSRGRRDEALDEASDALACEMEVVPFNGMPNGGREDEEEIGHGLHRNEQSKRPRTGERQTMRREHEAAISKERVQHAQATRPEVGRLQGMITKPQRRAGVSKDVSALILILGEANTSSDAAKASDALERLIQADPPLQAHGEQDEVLPVLVQALATFADNAFVTKPALAYLVDITSDEASCKQLMDLGVDRALASVIMASLHSLDLTKNACAVVLHMATWGYHDVSTELLAAVRAALKKYPKAIAALQAFRSLLVPGSQALEVLADDGGGLMVARVLRWTSSSFVQLQAALECTSSMCMGHSDVAATNRRHLGSHGAIDAIDSAINRCPKRAEILSAAVLALWTLSIDNDRNVQLMRAAGMATRLRGPGFQQIVQHQDCNLEPCAVCLRLELLRKLEATTSSEDDQFDDSRGRHDEALDEASDALACEMEVVPFNDIDTQDAPNGGREDEEEIGHRLHLNAQSKRPQAGERQATRREHEAAISKERAQHGQAARAEVGRPQGMNTKPQRRSGSSQDVSALVRMLGEANTRRDAAKASEALERLIKADPPLEAPGECDEVFPVLVRALAAFADRDFVMKPALAYLVDITSDEASCKQLMDLEVDRALASVIIASLHSSDLTKNACTVVLHMATRGYHEVSTELLVAVRAAVKKYFWSRTVFQACRSLLVPGSHALKVLAEDGGGEAVVRVVRWPSTRAMQVEVAFECIAGMCMGDSDAAMTNRRQLGSQGAIEAIGSVFSEHPRRPEVFSAGVKALWALSIDNDSNVQCMRAAGVAARLREPGFQQTVQHHGCHLESCEACMRFELLRKLKATTSSEGDECGDDRGGRGEALDEGSEELDCERKIVPIDATDRRDVPMRRVIEKKEEGGHGSPLDEQSKKPRAQVRRGVKRQHEAAILNERRQCAKAEHLEVEAPRRTSVEKPLAEDGSQSVKAFALILSEANTSSNAAEASKAVCRLQTDPPPCLGSGHWNRLLAVLTRTLVVFADIASVVTPILSYLEVVTGSASRCQQLLALGVDAALVAVMKGNKASPGIMHKACAVVLNMATRSCHEVSTELVVTVRDAVNKSTTGVALDALNALAVPGSQAYMALAQDDGYAALVRIVRETQRKSATVQSALQCIVTLCLGDSEAAVVNRQQLGAQGAIEAIDLALNRYSNRVEVLSTAIRALYTLSIDSSLVVRMKDREVAVRLTCPGFQQYVKDPECSVDFCEMCLRLVVNMALSSVEMREEMGNQGACSLVLKVFERPRPSEIREEARLLTAAIEAMATMCLDCPHNVHRFGSMGCEALSQVLGCRRLLRLEMPTFKALRKQACLATARLLEAVEHRQLLLESEMLHEVAGCLQSPRLEKDVPYLEAVLLALEAMTSDDTRPLHLPAPDLVQAAIETLRSISIRGAYEVPRRVVALLSKLSGHAGVTVPGVNFLCNLMRPSHDDEMVRLRETLGTYGACSVAAEAIGLRNGEPDGHVIGSGYLLAAALCLKCPANVQRLIALQVPASVLHDLRTAAEAHGGDADDGAVGIGLSGCCFLGQLLVNATGLGDREKLTQELRQDGACEALLAFLKSSAVCGQADKEQAVITTVELLLEGHEGTGHLEVASARALLESAIARGNDNSKDDGSSTSAQKR
jgi:hypothetical protein